MQQQLQFLQKYKKMARKQHSPPSLIPTNIQQFLVTKIEQTYRSNSYNGHMHNVYSSQIFNLNRGFMVIMLAQLLLLYLYIEYDLSSKDYCSFLLFGSNLCGILSCTIIFLRFLSRNPQYGIVDEIQQSFIEVCYKIAIILLSPYSFIQNVTLQIPDINTNTIHQFKLNHLLVITAFFRILIFFGIALHYSKYMSPRGNRISKLYGANPGNIFALRAIFKDSPFIFVMTMFTISIIVFCFSFRISEVSMYPESDSLTLYFNMLWMTIITMSSVGYGDYYPQTPVGRIIGSMCIIWGALILSVMVVVLTSAFSMNKSQSQTLRIINKLEHNKKVRKTAGEIIRYTLWRVWKNHKLRLNKMIQFKERKLLIYFKQLRNEQKFSFLCQNEIELYNEFTDRFDGAYNNLELLTQNNLSLVNHLNELLFKQQGKIKKDLPKAKVLLKLRKR